MVIEDNMPLRILMHMAPFAWNWLLTIGIVRLIKATDLACMGNNQKTSRLDDCPSLQQARLWLGATPH
jgi:hypothetical protein